MAIKNTPDLSRFAELAAAAFLPVLEPSGFSLTDQEVSAQHVILTFEQENRYVVVKADIHPGGSFFNVLLGEGKPEWPDVEWQAVALWRFIRKQVPASEADVYALPGPQGVEAAIKQAAQNLPEYAGPFLEGDLKLLRLLREGQAREQQPFRLADKDRKGVLKKLLEQQQQAEREQSEGNSE